MPSISSERIDLARSIFEKDKIFTINRLASILDCTTRTAQKKLRLWNAFTSYNQNGKYYTLPEIPQFNIHGLWRYNDISFSRQGNLKKTIVHLIVSSSAGFSGKQLGELLGLLPQSFMHHCRNYPGIRREKHQGVYIYFSADTSVYKEQLQQRISISNQQHLVTITDPEAVMVLVAVIKHHGISVEGLLSLPEIRKSKLTKSALRGFMENHDLIKKKPSSIP